MTETDRDLVLKDFYFDSKGQFGCFLSHHMLIRQIAGKTEAEAEAEAVEASDLDAEGYSVIFEDDVYFSQDLDSQIREIIGTLAAASGSCSPADIVYLGNLNENVGACVSNNVYLLDETIPCWGTHALLIRNKSAGKIYGCNCTPRGNIDNHYKSLIASGDLTGFVVHPSICFQNYSLQSQINPEFTVSVHQWHRKKFGESVLDQIKSGWDRQTTILLTGGLGFIGSHTAVVLLDEGYEVVILDNLYNADADVVDKIKQITPYPQKLHFIRGDLTVRDDLRAAFTRYPEIVSVIHFASLKSVEESVRLPLFYYRINLNCMINLLEVMEEFGCNNIVFSSSSTVYGSEALVPFSESTPTGRGLTCPYARTKYFQEEMLKDYCLARSSFRAVILRYFNPAGAHPSGLLGENPTAAPNNLMPYIVKVFRGEKDHLDIFGDDYETPDGTAVRDYIHVMDVAEGHAAVVGKAASTSGGGVLIYNLGTGKGTSVMELVNAFNTANHTNLPYKIVARRPGDVAINYASVQKAAEELGWHAKYGLEEICTVIT